ncbi:hypothetical protein LX32DRAFT_343838 [Colletotrichum zoysiae]|uniref:Uncharacterized protein n=1 Tax=Colletotrichum zoysiae TaxID=1216348 RepID=A0AAD9M0Z3_9PEZI|nr:hypothetical protein LX32DRAFT_343838 [Colletotrichum zoysiae]
MCCCSASRSKCACLDSATLASTYILGTTSALRGRVAIAARMGIDVLGSETGHIQELLNFDMLPSAALCSVSVCAAALSPPRVLHDWVPGRFNRGQCNFAHAPRYKSQTCQESHRVQITGGTKLVRDGEKPNHGPPPAMGALETLIDSRFTWGLLRLFKTWPDLFMAQLQFPRGSVCTWVSGWPTLFRTTVVEKGYHRMAGWVEINR